MSTSRAPGFELFGMRVEQIDMPTAVGEVLEMSAGPASLVVTPNTDHFLRWQRSAEFRELYDLAALHVLDGMPVVWLARILGARVDRVAGIDLFRESCRAAAREGVPVVILGGAEGVAEEAALRLRAQFTGLELPIVASPSPAELADPAWLAAFATRLAELDRKIVGVCLGSPKQEQFFASVRGTAGGGVYLGVGAAVDFLAGRVRRAPILMQRIGLEWLHRLAKEPGRLWRRYLVEDVRVAPYFLQAIGRRLSALFPGE